MADIQKLTLTIIRDECIGDGACSADAPTTFEIDGEGKAIVLESSTDSFDVILNAAKNCPTNCIVVVEKASGKQIHP